MSDLSRIAGEHNWLRRRTASVRSSMRAVMNSDTATDEAKTLANKIDRDAYELLALLEKRKDQV